MKKYLGYGWLFLGAALASCAQHQQQPLRIGTNLWTGYELLYLAREKALIDPRNVHLVEFSSSSDVIRAFRNGNIDAATLTLDEVLLLHETGDEPRIVLVTDISAGSDALLATLDVQSLSDLRGRRIAVENTALGAYFLTRMLDKAGLTLDEVELVALPYDEHERAFTRGLVDALVTFDPVRSRLLASGARELFSSKELPGEIVDVLAVRASSLERARPAVLATIEAWFSAIAEFARHRETAIPIMAKRHQMPDELFDRSLAGVRFGDAQTNATLLAQENPPLLENLHLVDSLMTSVGLLHESTDVNQIIEPEPLRLALKNAREEP